MALPKVPSRTTPGFAFSIMKRALLECIATREFGAREIAEVLAFFGQDPPNCAFCGSDGVQRWDHLVPVTSGGDTVLGNMVLTCGRCDDSKQHAPYEVWALGGARGSPKSRGIRDIDRRLALIHAYVAKYAYLSKTPEERLNPEELKTLGALRLDLAKARDDFDALVASFRKRSGLR